MTLDKKMGKKARFWIVAQMPEKASFDFDQIQEGDTRAHLYQITEEVYEGFISISRDLSPLHVDESYAKSVGFQGRVMHGSILNAFISHFVGMELPGKPALLHSVDIRFKAPSFLGDQISLEATVAQKVDAVRVLILDIELKNITRDVTAATAKVQVGVRE